MSREREKQRKKRDELARQLGVGRADAEEQKHLQEHERVTRPAVRLVSRAPTGLLRRLLDRAEPLVLALFLVEAKGARLVKAVELTDGARRELGKLVYHRPAHFVVVALPAPEPAPVIEQLERADGAAKLRLDGHALASDELASEPWEAPRLVTVEGLALPAGGGAVKGSAVSIRGVARTAAHYEFRLEKSVATIEVEV